MLPRISSFFTAPAVIAALCAMACGGSVVDRDARLPMTQPPTSSQTEPTLRALLGDNADVQVLPGATAGALGVLTGGGATLSTDSLTVRVSVAGRLARTEVTQVFRNHARQQIEGTYTFRLPDGASIARLAMDVNGVMMEGELVEREKARAIYTSIVNARKDPALLEWDGGNNFTTRIFPIPASGTKTVILAYEQLLPQEGRKVQYRYALPRLVGQPNATKIGAFAFSLSSLDAESGTLRGAPGQLAGKPLGVSIEKNAFVPDGPIDIELMGPAGESRAYVATHSSTVAGAHAVTQAFLIDWFPGADAPLADQGDVVLAFDTSASVGDVEFRHARAVARALVTDWPKERRVRVVYGDLKVWACDGSAAGGAEAAAFVDTCLSAHMTRGASDLGALFGGALAVAKAGPAGAHVVVFSDGVPSLGELDADLLAAGVAASTKDAKANVHTVAVGHEVDEDLLRVLARSGGGHEVRLRPDSEADATAETLAHLVRVPVITDIRAEVVDGDVSEIVIPRTVIARGEPATVLGRMKGSGAKLRVHGALRGTALSTEVALAAVAGADNPLVVRAWARARIGEMTAANAARQEVVDLSIRHGVMSPFTSFLVLETERMYEQNNIARRKEAEQAQASPSTPAAFRKGAGRLQDKLKADEEGASSKPRPDTMPAGLSPPPPPQDTGYALQGPAAAGGSAGARTPTLPISARDPAAKKEAIAQAKDRAKAEASAIASRVNSSAAAKAAAAPMPLPRNSGWPYQPSGPSLATLQEQFDAAIAALPAEASSAPVDEAIATAAAALARRKGGLEVNDVQGLARAGRLSVEQWGALIESRTFSDDVARALLRLVAHAANVVGAGFDVDTALWPAEWAAAMSRSYHPLLQARARASIDDALTRPGNNSALIDFYLEQETRAGRGAAADQRVLQACLSGHVLGATCYRRFANHDVVDDKVRLLLLTLARREDVTNEELLEQMIAIATKLGAHHDADRLESERVEFEPRNVARRLAYFQRLKAAGKAEAACAQAATAVQLEPARRELFRDMMDVSRADDSSSEAVERCITEAVSMLPVRRSISALLMWDDKTADIDLYIEEPAGEGDSEMVHYRHLESRQGGLLYYDVRNGRGPEIYTLGPARPGSYRIGVTYYGGATNNLVNARLIVYERAGSPDETRREFDVTVPALYVGTRWVTTVKVPAAAP